MEVSIIDAVVANNTQMGIPVRPTSNGTVRITVVNRKMLNNTGDGLIANSTTTGSIHVAIRDSVAADSGALSVASPQRRRFAPAMSRDCKPP